MAKLINFTETFTETFKLFHYINLPFMKSTNKHKHLIYNTKKEHFEVSKSNINSPASSTIKVRKLGDV